MEKILKCEATAVDGRINLVIRKGQDGYDGFNKVLNEIKEKGLMVWYGDVVDAEGKEQSGLVITSNVDTEHPPLLDEAKR